MMPLNDAEQHGNDVDDEKKSDETVHGESLTKAEQQDNNECHCDRLRHAKPPAILPGNERGGADRRRSSLLRDW